MDMETKAQGSVVTGTIFLTTLSNINCNLIPEREDWFINDRKSTICPDVARRKLEKLF